MKLKKPLVIAALLIIFSLILIGCTTETVNDELATSEVSHSNRSTSSISTQQLSLETKASQSVNSSESSNNSQSSKSAVAQETTKITNKLKVHFLDVGQADCILIQTPSGKNLLIDAGNNADASFITSYLIQIKIKKLDAVVGTHPHEDHIGALDEVINTFDIGNVYMPKVSNNTKTFQNVLTAIKNKNLKVKTAAAGIKIEMDSQVKIEILAPNGSHYDDLNDHSAVIKLTFGKTSFMLDGDAETISESEMLAKGYNLKADVLKIGHHGSNSSTSTEFLKAVLPTYAIISVGKDNDYGHPTQSTLTKLEQADISIFRTDENGTIIATSDGTKITFDKKPTVNTNKATVNNATTTNAGNTNVTNNSGKKENIEVTVYITNTGEKYHRDGCSSLSKSKIAISLKDAISKKYSPCKKCNPPTK